MPQRQYDNLTARLHRIAFSRDFELKVLGEFDAGGRSYPMFVLEVGSAGGSVSPSPQPSPLKGEGAGRCTIPLWEHTSKHNSYRKSALIAAGIHGDEPAGVEAALRFLETDNRGLRDRFHFTVFACNNPTGWERNTRENWQGTDLNRQFGTRNPPAEVELIMRGLAGRCFDLVFEMHEDVDSPGFYLYELADDPAERVGELIVQTVSEMGYPINRSRVIESRRAAGGVIRPNLKRFRKTRLPQAIYAHLTCGGHVLTLEPPASRLPLEDRVRIELRGLEIALTALGSAQVLRNH